MADWLCRCACGNTRRVSEFAMGMAMQCPKCGMRFTVSEENTKPLEPPQPAAPKIITAISNADQKPIVGQQQCARCKRPFRGDWDRYYSPAGMVCHVCANLAERVEPREPAPGIAPVKIPDVPPSAYIPTAPVEAPKEGKGSLSEQFEDFKQTSTFRAIIWGAAILVVGGALFVHFFGEGFNPPKMQESAYPEQAPAEGSKLFATAESLTQGQGAALQILVRALMLFFIFAPNFAALYWVLAQAERLPCYHWWSNAIHVAVAAAIMSVPIWAAGLMSGALGMAGGLLGLALYGVMYYILYEVYDLFVRDIVKLVLARFLLFLLVTPVQAFVYGGLGLLLKQYG